MIVQFLSSELSSKKNCTSRSKFYQKIKRNYSTEHYESSSRKISYYPEFLRTKSEKFLVLVRKKKKIKRTKMVPISFATFSGIIGFTYGVISLKRLLISSKISLLLFSIFLVEKLNTYTQTFFFIFATTILFSKKLFISKFLGHILFVGGLSIFIIKLENNLFFYEGIGIKWDFFLLENLIIIFFSNNNKFKRETICKTSSEIVSTIELRNIISFFCFIKIFLRILLRFLTIQKEKVPFNFFFSRWSFSFDVKNLTEFTQRLSFLKSGKFLIVMLSIFFFLSYFIFRSKNQKKGEITPIFQFYLLIKQIVGSKICYHLKRNNLGKNYFFLFEDVKNLENFDDFITKEYYSSNFFSDSNTYQWKVKKDGITRPFWQSFLVGDILPVEKD